MKHLSLFIIASFLLSSCGVDNPLSASSTTLAESTVTSTATPSPFPTVVPSPSSTPIPVSYVYEDVISAAERAEIELSMEWTYRYLSESGLGSPGPITVYAFYDIQKLTDISWPLLEPEIHQTKKQVLAGWQNGGGTVADGSIFVQTSFSAWVVDDPCYKIQNQAHEAWHLMQRQWSKTMLIGGDPMPVSGPEWLEEGSAQVFAFKVADQAHPGLCDYESMLVSRYYALTHAADLSLLASSSGASKASADGYFFDLTALAVDYLIENSPKGIESLKDFYQDIEQGSRWEEAFLDAFSQSVETFYAAFAVYNPWQ